MIQKRVILLFLVASLVSKIQAQQRRDVANFSLYKQYSNPSLTGIDGSLLKTFYRNQWSNIDGAPKTVFVSGELDLTQLKTKTKEILSFSREKQDQIATSSQGLSPHSFGLSYLQDKFGALSESQLQLNYSAKVRMSQEWYLRSGVGLKYNHTSLDAGALKSDFIEQELNMLLNKISKVSLIESSIGVSLVHQNYYIGYSMQDLFQGKSRSAEEQKLGAVPLKHNIQVGARRQLNESWGLIFNAIDRYDTKSGNVLDVQLKTVFMNQIWVSANYRSNLAYCFGAGMRFGQLVLGYTYEQSTNSQVATLGSTNEICLTYNFIKVRYPKYSKNIITMW